MKKRTAFLISFIFTVVVLNVRSEEINLIDRASAAKWLNGQNTSLAFGSDGEAMGTVKYITNVKLEDGKNYNRVLFLHPQWSRNGKTLGIFDNIKVPENGGRVILAGGFMDGAAGTDGVTFSVYFIQALDARGPRPGRVQRRAETEKTLCSLSAKYEGRIDRVECDISEVAGQEGYFVLSVDAGNNANSDWAVLTVAKLELGKATPKRPGPGKRGEARMIHAIKGHESSITWAVLSPNGKYFLTVDSSNTAMIFNYPGGKEILTFDDGYSNPPSFSPDSRRVVVGNEWGDVEIYDVSAERLSKTLKGHSEKVNSAQFSPNGRYIVTASDDGSAKVWDSQSGKEILSIRHSDRRGIAVKFAVFSHDGRRVITSGEDGTSRIWEVNIR